MPLPTSPLSAQLAAAVAIPDPSARRIVALGLNHRMRSAIAVPTATLALNWAALAALLDRCSLDLRLADDSRDADFRALATTAYVQAGRVRAAVQAQRAGAQIGAAS